MDFARNLLLKYGWKEGKGLGKKESGIPTAIKPKLKFNTDGLGFDHSEQFTNNWWEQAYNRASSNIDISSTTDGNLSIKTLNKDSARITTKKTYISDSEKETFEYGTFKKVGILEDRKFTEITPPSSDEINEINLPLFKQLTDEELYLACGGRTAHKAARHGHKMNGKLLRINKQDQLYSAKVNYSIPKGKKEDEMEIVKCKKTKHLKNNKLEESLEHQNTILPSTQSETYCENIVKKRSQINYDIQESSENKKHKTLQKECEQFDESKIRKSSKRKRKHKLSE